MHVLPSILELTASNISFQESFLQSIQVESPSDSKNILQIGRSHTISTNVESEAITKGKLSKPTNTTFSPPKITKTVPFRSPLQHSSAGKTSLCEVLLSYCCIVT